MRCVSGGGDGGAPDVGNCGEIGQLILQFHDGTVAVQSLQCLCELCDEEGRPVIRALEVGELRAEGGERGAQGVGRYQTPAVESFESEGGTERG